MPQNGKAADTCAPCQSSLGSVPRLMQDCTVFLNSTGSKSLSTVNGIQHVVDVIRACTLEAPVMAEACLVMATFADESKASQETTPRLGEIELLITVMDLHRNKHTVQVCGCCALGSIAYQLVEFSRSGLTNA